MKTSINKKKTSSVFFNSTMLLLFLLAVRPAVGQVIVSEDSISIPSYIVGAPNPMPRFYEGTEHQGVQRRIYPDPYNDNLTSVKEDKNYNIIHVENKFIDIGIMPGMGGRIYYAVDKTNNYNFFYRNHVIKPSLIGMVGYWISGSLAWGFPHHHGHNTVKPMDYKIVKNVDSSLTIWIANTDELRMSALIGYTIYPNSSLVDMSIRLMNGTAVSNPFLFWANPAVNADTTYQVIFPPSVQYVTFHKKVYMTTWPIADGWYNRYDFTGVDISWWKNTFVPSSFFSWEPKEDYFGGYNHGKEAGTVWLGNHHISGMKYWADGNNAAGRQINDGLTDNDGQYIEQMAGMYTDNQPDYSWIQPYESKTTTMTWFPIRELGGLKYANRSGALNLEVTKNQIVQLRMNTTSPHKQTKVVLMSKGQLLLQKIINISPEEPFKIDVPFPTGMKEDDLDVALYDENGQTLLSYKPAEHHPKNEPKPETMKPLLPPEKIKTVEELYLAGLRLNQFYDQSADPIPYYEKALTLDPGDYRVNTQLGILNIKNFKWEEAEKNLRSAVNRITSNYTKPKDSEAFYYLGIALRAQGKTDEAYDYFYKASWNYAFYSSAYYQLAEIDCQRGDFETALDNLNKSITTNSDNLKALNLKTIVLRKLNKLEAANEQAMKILSIDTLNHQTLNELSILNSQAGKNKESSDYLNEFTSIMRDEVQSYLELATDYGNCGLYQEAIDVLTRLEKKDNKFPMIYYYLGYYWLKNGDQTKAINYYQLASNMPSTYCFPFRAESISALRSAMQLNPKDSRAPYYLGNLLYEHQPENAIVEWEKSRELDNSFYIVHRNLGLAYEEVQKDNVKALASLEKAVTCNSDDPRLLFEVDKLYALNKVSPQKEYEFLKQHINTAKGRTETILSLATRAVESGKYDEALNILKSNDIVESEGSTEKQKVYLDAHTFIGLEYYNKGEFDKALKEFETDLAYTIGLYGRPRIAQFNYLAGITCEKMGNKKKAETFFQKALAPRDIEDMGPVNEYLYYNGMALQKLGRSKEAKKLFLNMLSDAQNKKEGSISLEQFGVQQSEDFQTATNHYLAGLAYEGLGEKEKSKVEFATALKFNPNLIWSKVHLDSL